MKKSIKKVILIIFVLFVFLYSTVATADDYFEKLNKELQTYLPTIAEEEVIHICVKATGSVKYPSQQELKEKCIEIMGFENYILSKMLDRDYMNQRLDLEQKFKKEAEEAFLNEFMKDINLEKTEDMYALGASLYFSTTKSEIIRLAKEERVANIIWFGNNGQAIPELKTPEPAVIPTSTVIEMPEPAVSSTPVVIETSEPAVNPTPTVIETPGITVNPTPAVTDTAVFYEKGDVNRDKKINAKDVLLVLKYFARMEKLDENQMNLADVNKNEIVDKNDVLDILKIAAKIV